MTLEQLADGADAAVAEVVDIVDLDVLFIGPQLQQVAASGPAGMPVVQAPIDKGKSHYAIAFAFRPGQNTVRYSYELPYPGNTATVKIPTVYPGGRLLVVAPPTVQGSLI